MKKMMNRVTAIAGALFVMAGSVMVPAQAVSAETGSSGSAPAVSDIDYEGGGKVDVEFEGKVRYRKAKVTVKDTKGKKYTAKILKKDGDDIKFKIKKFKKGRTYKFTVKGVKEKGTSGYGKVRDKVVIPKKAAAKNGRIGSEAAKTIALEDAGVTGKEVTFTEVEFDYEDGYAVYEIDFICGGIEYEYEIDAKTGDVLKREIDDDDFREKKRKGNKSSGIISAEKAKEIALKDAGLNESQVRFKKVKIDYEDGYKVYEVEFWYDYLEYEYEIDAKTGEILEADIDD